MAIPLNVVAHAKPKSFVWMDECDKAYQQLKIQLSRAPMVVPPNWKKVFHVFMDASDVSIASVLM